MNAKKLDRGPVYEKALTIAAERVAASVKEGYDAHLMLVMIGFGTDQVNRIETDDAIKRAIELGLLVKLPKSRYAVHPETLNTGSYEPRPFSLTKYIDDDGKRPVVETDIPFGDDEPARTPPEAEPLEFAGMKCRNQASAHRDQYWFYTGSQESAEAALAELIAVGVDAGIKQHGTKRHKEHIGEPPLWTLAFAYEANKGMLDAAMSRLTLEDFDGNASVWSGDFSDCRLVAKSYANRGRDCKVCIRAGETTITITE